MYYITNQELYHHGILGMKWGIRRFQPYPKGHKGGKEIGEAARVNSNLKKARQNRILVDKTKRNEKAKEAAKIVGTEVLKHVGRTAVGVALLSVSGGVIGAATGASYQTMFNIGAIGGYVTKVASRTVGVISSGHKLMEKSKEIDEKYKPFENEALRLENAAKYQKELADTGAKLISEKKISKEDTEFLMKAAEVYSTEDEAVIDAYEKELKKRGL